MNKRLWLAALVLSIAPAAPGASAPLDARAHTALTDGVRAGASADDPAWLTLFADSNQLPKTSYTGNEFCFWGNDAPFSNTPTSNPVQYGYLRDANIRGVRYDVPWYGVQQYKTSSFDWYNIESNINQYIQDGMSIVCVLSYTPHWANGLRSREYPPHQSIEGELVDLTTGSANLTKSPAITMLDDQLPFIVTPNPTPTTRFTNEQLTTNFTEGLQPRVAHYPVIVGTEQVWVDEGSGYQLWTRVSRLIDSPDGATHYEFDRSGRLKFRNNKLFYYHGKTPAAGSKIRISYDQITETYNRGTDYSVDSVTGQIKRRMATISGGQAEEDFSSAILSGAWTWMSAPTVRDINTTVPGHLYYKVNSTPATGRGHFLYQSLSGSGDFAASVRVTTAASTGAEAQTGLMIYQDANNWFRYALSNDAGRPILTRCVNGEITVHGRGGQLGFLITAPRWLTVRKTGDTYTVFTSTSSLEGPDGGYQVAYSFDQQLSYPLRVGISSVGTDTTGVSIDSFKLALPTMGADASVRVYYDYLDTQVWYDFVYEFVNHFKDRVRYWEMWNEPDQGWCWKGGQDLIAIMMREGSKAVKAADPTANVVSGGYANGSAGNIETVYKTVGNSWFDLIAWHPYNFSNKPPEAIDWGPGNTNKVGRDLMVKYGDEGKEVFFGETSSSSGVLASGGGLNDRKQVDYGMRLLLWSRKIGYVRGLQWWPGVDMAAVGQQEDLVYGGHDGLFYLHNGAPKPAYWMYRNVASNKGILLDLVSYDSAGAASPASGVQQVKKVVLGVQDRAALASVKVLTSLTATSDQAKSPIVAARHIGQALAPVMTVNVDTAKAAHKLETWTLTATGSTSFSVAGSVSGAQGTASVGVPFTSTNQVVSFTVPSGEKAYISGDKFEFETFAGDGFAESAAWTNPGLTGKGDISIELPSAVNTRYLSIQVVKAASAQSVALDEVQVRNSQDALVSNNALYVVDGYQTWFQGGGDPDPDPDLPPAQPTINPVTSPTNIRAQTVTGSRPSDAASVVVTCATATVGTVTYPGETTWSCTLTNLSSGINTVSARSRSESALESEPVTANIVVDYTPPAQPTINAVTSPTAVRTQVISGTRATDAAEVIVTCSTAVVGSVSYPSSTTWSCTLSELGSGANAVSVAARDALGNLSPAASASITTDFTPPAQPTINAVTSPTASRSQTLTGTKVADASAIIVTCATANVGTVTYPTSTTWSCPLTNLGPGSNSISVKARDALANESTSATTSIVVDTEAPAVPTINPVTSPTNSRTQTLTGTKSQDTAAVVVTCTTASVGSMSYPTATTWSCTLTNLSSGTNNISAKARDSFLNESASVSASIVVDYTAPAAPSIAAVTSPTASRSQTIGGSKATDATAVVVTCATATVGEASYPSATSWSCQLTNLSSGSNSISARARDAVGNESAAASTTIVVDLTPPAAPTINAVVSPTASRSQTITGGKAADAALVTVTCATATESAVTYPTSTTWSCALSDLSSGSNTITAVARDSVGNESSPATATIVVDYSAPAAPTINAVTSPTSQRSQTIGGSKAADAASVTVACATATVGAVSYPTATTWSCALTELRSGANSISVRARDSLGNESAAATASITVDSTAPATPVINAVTSPTANRSQTITGTRASDAATIVVTCASGSVGSVTYPSGTSWSCPLTNLTVGSNSISAVARDSLGNESSPATATIVVDTSAPSAPTINPVTSPTNSRSQTITGTKAADASTVTVTCSTATESSVTYPTSTSWSCSLSNMVSGTNNISVTARDSVGNQSPAATTSIVVDYSAPSAPTIAAVTSPTSSANQTIGGTKPTDATSVVLSCATATVGVATYPSATSWSCAISGLSSGSNAISARSRDAAGNESASVSATIVADFAAPAQPTINPVTSPTNSRSQTISGTKASDATAVIVECATASEGAVSYPSSTTWSCNLTNMTEGANVIAVTARDLAGNTSAAASATITADLTPPAAPVFNPVASPTRERAQTLSGTRPADAVTVTVTCSTATVGTVTYPTATTWSCPVSNLSAGANTISARCRDASGNDSTAATASITYDDSAPPTPLITLSVTSSPQSQQPGGIVTHTITYTNDSAAQAKTVAISFPIPAQMDYVTGSASAGGSYDALERAVRWTIATVAPRASGTLTLQTRVK